VLPLRPDDPRIPDVDIDPNRPNVKGKCPWCGGWYLAGYRTSAPEVQTVWHTLPTCPKWDDTPHKAQFLTDARKAGAVRMRVHEGEPVTPELLDGTGRPLKGGSA